MEETPSAAIGRDEQRGWSLPLRDQRSWAENDGGQSAVSWREPTLFQDVNNTLP